MLEFTQHLQLGLLRLLRSSIERGGEAADAGQLSLPFSTVDHRDWWRSVELWNDLGVPLLRDAPRRDCPACECLDHSFLFTSYDGFPFHRCHGCGTWFVPLVIDQSIYERFWRQCPEALDIAERAGRRRTESHLTELGQGRIDNLLRQLEPFLPEKAADRLRYLDVGCGVGHSLAVAARRGWHGEGVEIDRSAADSARRMGHRVSEGIPGAGQEPYDIVSFWESLEHVAAPGDLLRQCVDLLSPNGVLGITIPNLHSPNLQLLRGDCFWINGGVSGAGHINMFSRQGLNSLLRRSGLTAVFFDGDYGNNRLEFLSYLLGKSSGASAALSNKNPVIHHDLPKVLVDIERAIGPFMTMIDRISGLAPIVRVVAVRDSRKTVGESVGNSLRVARDRAILADIDESLAPLEIGAGDEITMGCAGSIGRENIAHSQGGGIVGRAQTLAEARREIDLREDALLIAQRSLEEANRLLREQGEETTKRDHLLAGLQADLHARGSELVRLQDEVNRRDSMLKDGAGRYASGLADAQREVELRDAMLGTAHATINLLHQQLLDQSRETAERDRLLALLQEQSCIHNADIIKLQEEVGRRDSLLAEMERRNANALAEIQREVDRRDGLLGDAQAIIDRTHRQLIDQGEEITRRDRLLASLQSELLSHSASLARAQAEINRRDAMLAELQGLANSLQGRLGELQHQVASRAAGRDDPPGGRSGGDMVPGSSKADCKHGDPCKGAPQSGANP